MPPNVEVFRIVDQWVIATWVFSRGWGFWVDFSAVCGVRMLSQGGVQAQPARLPDVRNRFS